MGQGLRPDLYERNPQAFDRERSRELFDRHDFEVLGHRLEDPDCGGRTVWLSCKR